LTLNPFLLQASKDWDPLDKINVKSTSIPFDNFSLSDIGIAIQITGQEKFPLTILIQPYDPSNIQGINLNLIRFFLLGFKYSFITTSLEFWN